MIKKIMGMNKMSQLQQILDRNGYSEWIDDNDLLICPHGNVIELDGSCPDGCKSPLIEMGMI